MSFQFSLLLRPDEVRFRLFGCSSSAIVLDSLDFMAGLGKWQLSAAKSPNFPDV
jgi:hypothetical protein